MSTVSRFKTKINWLEHIAEDVLVFLCAFLEDEDLLRVSSLTRTGKPFENIVGRMYRFFKINGSERSYVLTLGHNAPLKRFNFVFTPFPENLGLLTQTGDQSGAFSTELLNRSRNPSPLKCRTVQGGGQSGTGPCQIFLHRTEAQTKETKRAGLLPERGVRVVFVCHSFVSVKLVTGSLPWDSVASCVFRFSRLADVTQVPQQAAGNAGLVFSADDCLTCFPLAREVYIFPPRFTFQVGVGFLPNGDIPSAYYRSLLQVRGARDGFELRSPERTDSFPFRRELQVFIVLPTIFHRLSSVVVVDRSAETRVQDKEVDLTRVPHRVRTTVCFRRHPGLGFVGKTMSLACNRGLSWREHVTFQTETAVLQPLCPFPGQTFRAAGLDLELHNLHWRPDSSAQDAPGPRTSRTGNCSWFQLFSAVVVPCCCLYMFLGAFFSHFVWKSGVLPLAVGVASAKMFCWHSRVETGVLASVWCSFVLSFLRSFVRSFFFCSLIYLLGCYSVFDSVTY